MQCLAMLLLQCTEFMQLSEQKPNESRIEDKLELIVKIKTKRLISYCVFSYGFGG